MTCPHYYVLRRGDVYRLLRSYSCFIGVDGSEIRKGIRSGAGAKDEWAYVVSSEATVKHRMRATYRVHGCSLARMIKDAENDGGFVMKAQFWSENTAQYVIREIGVRCAICSDNIDTINLLPYVCITRTYLCESCKKDRLRKVKLAVSELVRLQKVLMRGENDEYDGNDG